MHSTLELLSPAKDLQTGVAAINCGADAVYIGAPKFGARAAAGNTIEDIKILIEHAHKFWAKVYVTVNTIIYDDEIADVEKLIHQLYEIGTDAIIFQDMALLKMNLPPIPLFASTQTHNYELERIKFLDSLGIKRIILARELSLSQLKKIREQTNCELEFFVHGALCVSLSGQCYMSEAMSGRSANRGECAQPCRMQYSLVDDKGNTVVKDKHLLSLRDLNLSAYLNDLIEAGVTSFKIEGRLKDVSYVKNITAYYRQKLDELIEQNQRFKRASIGGSNIPFTPDPEITFNRGYTSYFFAGKDNQLTSTDTPKSKGKLLGEVSICNRNSFTLKTNEKIINGDGLCYIDESGELTGMYVNKIEGDQIFSTDILKMKPGTKIFRNHDHQFYTLLNKKECSRNIKAKIKIDETTNGILVSASDESNISVSKEFVIKKENAGSPGKAVEVFKKQFSKSGETIFSVEEVVLNFNEVLFLTVKECNLIRREILKLLEIERVKSRPIETFKLTSMDKDYPTKILDYRANVVNHLAREFYIEHGAEKVNDGFEISGYTNGTTVMVCKYCIKDELHSCPLKGDDKLKLPLFLQGGGRKYSLHFNCKECLMEVKIG